MAQDVATHAFISYVHEDRAAVDRIEQILRSAGISVWRDTNDLWPGEDWRRRIKSAITDGALVFIACFSDAAAAKPKSYQREEIILAVEELRLRNPEVTWLIPVRLSECELPRYPLGADRDLDSLQRVDLFGEGWETGAARLVASVLRVLGRSGEIDHGRRQELEPEAFVKGALLDPTRQIELDDYVRGLAINAVETLKDESLFPSSAAVLSNPYEGARFIADQVDRYWTIVDPLIRAIKAGAAWGRPDHSMTWTTSVEAVANTARETGGHVVLVALRRFPTLPLLLTAAISAINRSNFGPLRAIAVDTTLRSISQTVPLIADSSPYRAFDHGELGSQILALEADGEEVDEALFALLQSGRKGKRHTPVSDLLHARLRPYFSDLIPDDETFGEVFDRAEILLGVLASDQSLVVAEGTYVRGAWFGRFTWHDRGRVPLEERMRAEAETQGTGWPPVAAGLFGADTTRALAAFDSFIEAAGEVRRHRW